MPWVAFVAGDADARVDLWACSVEASPAWTAVAHRGLRKPEDLFVGRRALGIRGLVRLLDDLKIAALLAWAVQHHAQPAAVALQRDGRYTFDLGTDRDILPDPTFAQAEDVLVAARPAILDEKGQNGLTAFARVNSQAKRKFLVARLLEHPLSDDVWRQHLRAIVSGYRHTAVWEANDIAIASSSAPCRRWLGDTAACRA